MLNLDDYARIRLAHRDGMSLREIARTFGHSRVKIRQVLQEAEPKPYTLRTPRARVTQIINLTNLAPDIQQAILNLEPTTDHVPRFREREVRTIAILPNWEKQRVLWKRLVKRSQK